MLVSLHLPKTAGTSFQATLEAAFGAHLLTDYADLPLHHSRAARRASAIRDCLRYRLRGLPREGIQCIHGHFLPLKYRCLRTQPLHFVTWLRDPLQRLVSHYYYWQRNVDAATAGPLHQRMIREQWTLEEFCLRPELRNVYREFLWGFAPRRFAFIGITEHFASDMQDFARRFLSGAGSVASSARINANPEQGERPYHLDPPLRQRIEAHHAADMALYRWALQQRELRLQNPDDAPDQSAAG